MPERESVPRDKVNLRLLLIDGKTHDFLFGLSAKASEIASHVFHNWPSEWEDESAQKPERPEILRLIYRGRFLHGSTPLSALSLPLGKTTVLHMVVRERLPDEPISDSQNSQHKSRQQGQEHSCCCTIL